MNTLFVAGSMVLVAIIGYYYFKYQDWKTEKNSSDNHCIGSKKSE